MIDNYELPEEELVRLAAGCPRLSRGLKQRVFDAALLARRRRTARRAAAVMVCFLGVTFGGTYVALQNAIGQISPHAGFTAQSRGYGHLGHEPLIDRELAVEFIQQPAELIAMAGIGEWDTVDAFLMLREARSLALRGAL